jgi:hypothetical protein
VKSVKQNSEATYAQKVKQNSTKEIGRIKLSSRKRRKLASIIGAGDGTRTRDHLLGRTVDRALPLQAQS